MICPVEIAHQMSALASRSSRATSLEGRQGREFEPPRARHFLDEKDTFEGSSVDREKMLKHLRLTLKDAKRWNASAQPNSSCRINKQECL
jgi:hypothetical protein